jgi:hypothetical protein
MLAVVAAILFLVAWVIRATAAATVAALPPASLILIGLACLALYLAGVGPGGRTARRTRRR